MNRVKREIEICEVVEGRRCPWCWKKVDKLVVHHLDYMSNLTTRICKDCHFREHFPGGKLVTRRVLSKRARKVISVYKSKMVPR